MTSRSATFTLPRYTAPSRRLSLASRPSDSGSLLDDKGAVRGDTGRTSTDSMSESGYDTVDTDEYAPPKRSLEECASTFYDQAQGVSNQLEPLKATYDSILALSSRLLVLHPNDIATPELALDLRESLLHTASTLKVLDSNLYDLWESEERVRIACEKGSFSIEGLRGSQLMIEVERRDLEVQGLIRRMRRRCKDIKAEAKWEREERREVREEKREPVGVDDYLEGGTDCPDLTKKDFVHASRWVVTNPFTILSKLLDSLRALKIPEMAATAQTPSTFVANPLRSSRRTESSSCQPETPFASAPLLSSNPTPVGNGRKPLSNWKSEILRGAPARPTALHKSFDRVSDKMGKDWVDTRGKSGRARAEKWIVIASLALLPLILIAVFVEKLFSSSSSSSSSKSSDTSLTTLYPTMINQGESSTMEGSPLSSNLANLRRRDSYCLDSQLV